MPQCGRLAAVTGTEYAGVLLRTAGAYPLKPAMDEVTVPNRALIVVGDGEKALFLRNKGCERLCHDARVPHFLLDLAPGRHEAMRRRLLEPRLQRFIGVIYRPDTELMSHYAEASLPQQFDAYVWFDETTPVTPLGAEHIQPGIPDTYPFGL